MGSVSCALLEAESDLRNFDCGNPSINKLVTDSYFPHIVKQCMVYKILYSERRVGFLSLSIIRISLDNSDAPVAEYFEKEPSFGAVKLDFIAIDMRLQRKNIGSVIMEYIIQKSQELYKTWPVRLLILEALRDKIEWYKKLGFKPINHLDLHGNSHTVQMYFDLMPEIDQKRNDMYSNSLRYIIEKGVSQHE